MLPSQDTIAKPVGSRLEVAYVKISSGKDFV
jgi:hypothetical protein